MGSFEYMLLEINSLDCTFEEASQRMIRWIDETDDYLGLVDSIGCIPESIEHDSTAEKLFAKVSDAVLSRGFREIGLKSTVLDARADSADVFAESPIHGYTLVADAKAFRLSRTAKNQKDFKVNALSNWRKDSDYAVLCAPYFQYPSSTSQIYKQSLDENVALFSWEYLSLFIRSGIKEDEGLNLSSIWNWPALKLSRTMGDKTKNCYLKEQDNALVDFLSLSESSFASHMNSRIDGLQKRSETEIEYWLEQEKQIRNLSREEAIEQLLATRKIGKKIEQIEKFVKGLTYASK